jgi:hypothetical protein
MVPGNSKMYEITWRDGNGQVKTHMPTVTRMFIDKYLRANAKETTRVKRGMFSGSYKSINSFTSIISGEWGATTNERGFISAIFFKPRINSSCQTTRRDASGSSIRQAKQEAR